MNIELESKSRRFGLRSVVNTRKKTKMSDADAYYWTALVLIVSSLYCAVLM